MLPSSFSVAKRTIKYNIILLAMFSMAPIITNMTRNMLNSVLPGLTVKTCGKFSLLGTCTSQMISLPNHLPSSTYVLCPHPQQKGQGIQKRRTHCPQPSQKGGIGPLAMAGMALTPVLLQPLLSWHPHFLNFHLWPF